MRLALAVLALSAVSALAQQPCTPTPAAMATVLGGGKYSEQLVVSGITSGSGQLIRLWANPQTGTWSLTIQQAGTGITCIVATGEDFTPGGTVPEAKENGT